MPKFAMNWAQYTLRDVSFYGVEHENSMKYG